MKMNMNLSLDATNEFRKKKTFDPDLLTYLLEHESNAITYLLENELDFIPCLLKNESCTYVEVVTKALGIKVLICSGYST